MMGIFTKLFGGADGCREAMHESYTRHVKVARQGKAGVANIDDAHYIGLYGALGSRYSVRGHPVNEAQIMAELAPFCAMENEQQAIEALAEYVLYQEDRSEARIEWLKWCINSVLQSCEEEHWLGLTAMGVINRVSWCDLLNPETIQILERSKPFAEPAFDKQELPYSSGNEIQKIMAMAENGNADAQGALGLAYHYGEGVHQDNVQAAYWFRKSADQGNTVAQSMLEKYPTAAPKITALQQAQSLAINGDAHWQYKLGVMYAYGQDVTQDYQEALKWFRLSATQGNPEAQCDLGAMYQGGFGVEEDHVQAMMWFLIAKTNGSTLPDQNLQQLESQATPAQIAEAQRMAREWRAAHHPTN